MSKTPIKRHPALQPLSREHHQGLLLVFKIGKGLERGVAPERIHRYILWFYEQYLKAHFKAEEKYLFTLLEANDEGVQQALEDHHQINSWVMKKEVGEVDLMKFKQLLERHIRFEERQLFNRIQEESSKAELAQLALNLEEEDFCHLYEDEFWK
ncbi:MAG: hemerythrin domain-containing protein [Vicingaceae bacterium]